MLMDRSSQKKKLNTTTIYKVNLARFHGKLSLVMNIHKSRIVSEKISTFYISGTENEKWIILFLL